MSTIIQIATAVSETDTYLHASTLGLDDEGNLYALEGDKWVYVCSSPGKGFKDEI